MAKAAWIILILSMAVSSHGFSSYEEALHFLERLDNEVEQQTEGLKLLIEDGKRVLAEQYGLELSKAKARSEGVTADILGQAEARGCPPQVSKQIAQLGGSGDDRWQKCMSLTRKLADFENATYFIYQDFVLWRPTICDAANNVSYCFTSGNPITKVMCAYDGMSGYLSAFGSIKDQVIVQVKNLNILVQNAVDDFKVCFGLVQSADKEEQLRILETGCPRRKGKLISTLSS